MCTFDPKYTANSVVPDLTEDEKSKYLSQEMERVQEMLDGAEDCKWVYQSLIQISFLRKSLDQDLSAPLEVARAWVDKLLELDPLRKGRWKELRETL